MPESYFPLQRLIHKKRLTHTTPPVYGYELGFVAVIQMPKFPDFSFSTNDRHVVLFFCKYKKYIDCRQIKTCFSFKLVNLRQKALDVVHVLCTQEKANRQVAFMSNLAIILGRDYWTRTSDLAPPRRVRYQLR